LMEIAAQPNIRVKLLRSSAQGRNEMVFDGT